jgi:RNA polymerase sigma-70 factor (ECF subfamily)
MWEVLEEIPDVSVIEGGHSIDGELLEKAILLLPEGFRLVFNLIEVEGYAHKEVAEMLGISEGTSKSQLFHAKKRLKDLLINKGYV